MASRRRVQGEPITAKLRRCAINTRKSSEEGLAQGFNSLHAQREACAAFSQSRQGGGWRLIETAYDLWLLGRHRIDCGDAFDATSYTQLMLGKKAAMVFTDPPYNVAIAGNVSGLGGVQHGNFAMASGELSE